MITLEVWNEDRFVRRVSLARGTHTMGSRNASVTLAFPTVSGKHAEAEIQESGFKIRDLGSRNGTFVRNSRIGPEWISVSKDEAIRIGPFTLKQTDAPASASGYGRFALAYREELSRSPQTAMDQLRARFAKDPAFDETVANRITREFHGDGPLHSFLRDSSVREVLVNSYEAVFIDRGKGPEPSAETFLDKTSYEAWATRTAARLGRRLDLQNPICEATLEDGARFHAVLPPVSATGLSVSIRRFGAAPVDEETALATDWVSRESLEILKAVVSKKLNCVISGGTSSGKTSLLNFLCRYLGIQERILTVEDTVELSPPVINLVQLQARKANADGAGAVTLRSLVQCALRMRPDRIIVGECRGDEVLEMLQALNTGHPGSFTTIHSNSCAEALQRLELLCLLGTQNVSVSAVREWIATSVEVVVQVERNERGLRYVKSIIANPRACQELGITSEGAFREIYSRMG